MRPLPLAGRTAVNLDLLEGQYRDDAPALETLVECLGAKVSPGTRLLAPAALDGHRSHRVVRAAALVLRERGRLVTLYADVPHATRYGWPRWVSGASGPADLHPDAFGRTT